MQYYNTRKSIPQILGLISSNSRSIFYRKVLEKLFYIFNYNYTKKNNRQKNDIPDKLKFLSQIDK